MRLEFDDQDKKERRIRGLILGSWLVLFLMIAVLAGSKLYTGFKAKQLAKEAAENEEETVLNSQALAKMKETSDG